MATRRFGRIEFYTDEHKEHRWRVIAQNGRILADSGEGYKRKAGAIKGAQATMVAIDLTLPE